MVSTSTYDVCSGLDNFAIIGINYHKADTAVRSHYAICTDTYNTIAEKAKKIQIQDLVILSTCNRTELIGVASVDTMIKLLCDTTGNDAEGFKKHGYIFTGLKAIDHLFKVAAGLDSQIVGDYEILMQLKKATRIAKENDLLGSLLDRLISFALQGSKKIKTETRLSTGTVSVAYAAIEVIKEKLTEVAQKNILLIGAGKFGCNVAKNIREYFPQAKVSITNRTYEKAALFAIENNMHCVPYENMQTTANQADVIIVSTNKEEFSLSTSDFASGKQRLLLDLSVPKSIDPAVGAMPGHELMDVDEISVTLNDTFTMRKAEIPHALAIIEETKREFVEWHKMFLHRPFLTEVKTKLYELSETHDSIDDSNKNVYIQKAVKTLAVDLRTRTAKGCQYINTMNEYLQMPKS